MCLHMRSFQSFAWLIAQPMRVYVYAFVYVLAIESLKLLPEVTRLFTLALTLDDSSSLKLSNIHTFGPQEHK